MTVNWKLGETLVLKATAKTIEKLTKLMAARITGLTPVGDPILWTISGRTDPHPGLLKASWTAHYDSTKQEGTIYNPQPYAHRIEFGWSTQAPSGMVRVAKKEFGGMLTYASNGNKI